MIGGDASIMAELVESYLEETPKLLLNMQGAVLARSTDQLGRAAHTMKSTAHDFGAESLAGLAQGLEAACRSGHPENAGQQISAIAQALELSHVDLKAYLKALPGG